MKILLQIVLLLFFASDGWGQQRIRLKNPSFEDKPKAGEVPSDWHDCSFNGETPPDVQPGSFQVTLPPQDGYTYLGLVVRDNETWEAVGQGLPQPLLKDSVYELRIYLARSELYFSTSRLTGQEVNYATPVILQVWGGTSYCEKAELLATSPLITHTVWKEYALEISPLEQDKYDYITLEAYYKTPTQFPYNGNLLLDNCLLTKKQENKK